MLLYFWIDGAFRWIINGTSYGEVWIYTNKWTTDQVLRFLTKKKSSERIGSAPHARLQTGRCLERILESHVQPENFFHFLAKIRMYLNKDDLSILLN
jgi:hypothetical protein